MNTDELKSLLKQSQETVERQLDCPDDHTLASYIDGGLSERDHGRFEHHVADCAYCTERVGALGRAREAESTAQVPELLRARSGKLANAPGTKNAPINPAIWRKAPRWAAAAVVVLAIGVLSQFYSPSLNRQEVSPSNETPGQPARIRETRNMDPGATGPSFLSPLEGMTIIPDGGVFNWTPVHDSLYYQLRIVSDEGDLVWQERVDGTQWALPAGLSLSPGAEYFVRVDAYLAEAKALNSDYVLFRVGDG